MKNLHEGFQLLPGDILFQDSGNYLLNQAIKTVTIGNSGARMDHCAVCLSNNQVVEALPEGVVKTGMVAFLNRSLNHEHLPKVMVGRLAREHAHLIPKMLEFAANAVGQPYNGTFDMGSDGFYCSELVYKATKYANCGHDLFELVQMTFKNPETGETDPGWVTYFQNLGVAIPEGKPGINPASISLSERLVVVHTFSNPLSWTGINKNK